MAEEDVHGSDEGEANHGAGAPLGEAGVTVRQRIEDGGAGRGGGRGREGRAKDCAIERGGELYPRRGRGQSSPDGEGRSEFPVLSKGEDVGDNLWGNAK